MPTYVVTWNSTDESWPTRVAEEEASAKGLPVDTDWSFRVRRESPLGGRVFLLRQNSERGIIASGVITSDTYVDDHWNAEAATPTTTYVHVRWDVVLPTANRLPIELLLSQVTGHQWQYVLNSGQLIKPPADAQLEEIWRRHLAAAGRLPAASGEWDIEPGTIVTRRQIAERFGGARQGGIQPSRATPNILVYSDPSVGRKHGYDYDGQSDGAYYYTGEGQAGNQQIRAGNRSLLNHRDSGRTLRLFEAIGAGIRGEKPQRYLGAYEVDQELPYRWEPARDRNGEDRRVIVFRLIPTGPAVDTLRRYKASAPTHLTTTVVEMVAPEANLRENFSVASVGGREGVRWEASLMRRLESLLSRKGHVVKRIAIRPAGETTRLITDTYDHTKAELFEIKPSASRAHIRLAIAQLLDYRRHVRGLRAATVLVPNTPSADLIDLVRSSGLGLAVFSDDSIDRLV